MSLDPVSKLASNLASTANETNTIKQNLSPDDEYAQLQIQFNEQVVVDGTLGASAIKRTYASDSFVLDHAVLGELDSSVLKLDGGYVAGASPFPLTFPISLGDGGELLYNINI